MEILVRWNTSVPSKVLIRVECFVFRQRNPLLTLEKWHECVMAVTSF